MSKLIFLTLLLAFATYALDINKFKERKCEEVNPAVNLEWMASVPQWYFPLWSKLDLIYTANGMMNKSISDLKENDLLNGKSCPIFRIGKAFKAFGLTSKLDVQQIPNGLKWKLEGQPTYGMSKFQLTDNKSFILVINCLQIANVDESTWTVLSTETKIKKELKTKILNHIQSLGFDPKLTQVENYSNCKV